MKRKILLFATLLVACIGIYAQSVDEVTLIVNGSGATKEDAVHTALRGAIEQAYGVFVSANTTILNDELVKDEIVTITSGNVKSFTELESVALPNGSFAVTLQAVVSTQKLAAYAKSKGASCEFAGATFGANLKLLKLNQINTEKAFDNLMIQLETLAPYIFDFNLELGQPKQNGEFGELPITIKIISNDNTVAFVKLLQNTMKALALNGQQINDVKALGHETFGAYLRVIDKYGDWTTREYNFYSPFPYKRLRMIIEVSDRAYVVKSDLGHVFMLFDEKERYKYKPYDNTSNLCVDHRDVLIIPECPEIKQKKPRGKSKKHEEIPPKTIYQPIEIDVIKSSLKLPIEDLVKISNFDIVKVNWIDVLLEQEKKDPNNLFIYSSLSDYYDVLVAYYLKINKYEELMDLITMDIEREPKKWRYYESAIWEDLRKSTDEEDNFLLWCVEKYPDNLFFYKSLCDYYRSYNSWDKLMDLTEMSIEKNPENKFYYEEFMDQTEFVYDPSRARISFFDQLIAKNPNHILPHYYKAYSCTDLWEKMKEYEIVIKLDPSNADAYQNLAHCYIKYVRWSSVKESIVYYYRQAAQMYEKLRILDDGTDPERTKAWVDGLYKCYQKLGMKKELSEISKIRNQK